ncbi:hypothetical protein FJY70_05910, partial [candidate division WOR-3 bacterium]|nr:hypothetical protein [candidate division WOR-3 bacterium]
MVHPTGAQSFFNSRGLGEVTPSGDARIAALAEPYALSTLNPGIFVGLNRTSFAVTAIGIATAGKQGTSTRLLPNVRPAMLNLVFPLPAAFRLFGGINQKFGQDFNVWSESLADTAYRRHVIGRGGIYTLRAGVAKSLFDRFCLGAEYGHLLGGSRENWRFESEAGGYTSTDTIEVDYAANTFKVGASFQSRLFTLAGYYEPSLNLSVRRDKRVHGVISDTTRTYALSLPHTLCLAAAVNPMRSLGLNLGFTLSPWSGATIAKRDSVSSLGYRDVWRGSVGIEYD